MSLQNMQNAISYASRWTRDDFIKAGVTRIYAELQAKGQREEVYVPGAVDNRYVPQPGDAIEDAARPLTVVANADGDPCYGVFDWAEDGSPLMRMSHWPLVLGPCAQVRAVKRGGFTPRTGPSVVVEARFDVSKNSDTPVQESGQ
jgi:hypothetical protein